MNTNEEVVEEVEEEEIVEEVIEETPKSIEDLTDDDIAKMSDEDMVKLGEPSKEAEEVPETVPEEKNDEEDKKEEDEFTKSEEYQKYNKNERGLYHQMKEERHARQEYERKVRELELDRERLKAASEVHQKYLDRAPKDVAPESLSEHDKVLSEISTRAAEYEKEYGEKYRMGIDEYSALEAAKRVDNEKHSIQWQAKEEERVRQSRIREIQDITTKAETELTSSEEYKDYPYVYKTYVEPMINPNLNPNPKQAQKLAAGIINAIEIGENPAKYAYEFIATLSEGGRKYFRDKMLKKQSKDLIENDKKIPKTSAHYTGAKPSTGKTLVTSAMVEKDESWYGKLTDDQLMKVGAGENVYI